MTAARCPYSSRAFFVGSRRRRSNSFFFQRDRRHRSIDKRPSARPFSPVFPHGSATPPPCTMYFINAVVKAPLCAAPLLITVGTRAPSAGGRRRVYLPDFRLLAPPDGLLRSHGF
uniref:Uncharacterized protein n=1 Tax=Steinernema glaseri TaxID=37863 RepID=A0A1I8ARA8_9BILA